MPSLVHQLLQLRLRAEQPSPECPRAVCKRFRRCVPPPDYEQDKLPRCPFMTWQEGQEWEERLPAALEPVVNLLHRHPQLDALLRSGALGEIAAEAARPLSRRSRRRLPWYAR